jgi:hypothetical protein
MTSGHDDDVTAALLIQVAAHAERLTDLDARESAHQQAAAAQLEHLADRAGTASARIDAIASILGRHATVISALDGLDRQVTAIASQLADYAAGNISAAQDYEPVPQPRWWRLTDAERQTSADRLRAWVEQVYRPGYGRLAAALPPCWEQHPICLYTLDWLSELWSALYLNPQRTASTLAAQAEWQTRLLPAAADQMAADAMNCRHGDVTRTPSARPRFEAQP